MLAGVAVGEFAAVAVAQVVVEVVVEVVVLAAVAVAQVGVELVVVFVAAVVVVVAVQWRRCWGRAVQLLLGFVAARWYS